MAELLEAQAEREQAEGGVVRVLIAAARQRLAAVNRRRVALDAANRLLIQENEAIFAASSQRVAQMGERAARGTAVASDIHARAVAEAAKVAADKDAEMSKQQNVLSLLQREVDDLCDEIAQVRGEAESLEAGEEMMEFELRLEELRALVVSTEEDFEEARASLEQQASIVRGRRTSDQERRQTVHTHRLMTVSVPVCS